MKISDVSLSLQVIERGLEDIPITLEEDGVSVAMFNLGSITTSLRSLVEIILREELEEDRE